ncbi:MAG: DUF6273 domain-containing protein [bacterium]|nr:DUF6273 domain-containing protein [bacterium]
MSEGVIYTGDNPKSGNKGSGETSDRVFCLSIEEACRYFGNSEDNCGCAEIWHSEALDRSWRVNRERTCIPTEYAISHYAKQGKNEYRKEAYKPTSAPEWWFDNCPYWLRSPGEDVGSAALVNSVGGINAAGYVVFSDGCAVRPALRVKLQ